MEDYLAEKVGELVKNKVKDCVGGFLGRGSKEDDKGDKKKDDEDEGGFFSLGRDKKCKDKEDEGGIFSRFLKRDDDDDDDDRRQKKSGFSGLFTELEGGPSLEGGPAQEGGGTTGIRGPMVPSCDGDLLDDLYNVANESP